MNHHPPRGGSVVKQAILLQLRAGQTLEEIGVLALEHLCAGRVVLLLPEPVDPWSAERSLAAPRLHHGDVMLDVRNHTLRGPLGLSCLSRLEFGVLLELMVTPEAACSYRQLSECVWGFDCHSDTAALRSVARRLRQRLQGLGSTALVVALPGHGLVLTQKGDDGTPKVLGGD